MKKLVWKYLWLTVASIIYSCGVSSFIDANNFAPGGVSGLCISLNRLIPLEIGTLFFLLNIPILILGFWKFGGLQQGAQQQPIRFWGQCLAEP